MRVRNLKMTWRTNIYEFVINFLLSVSSIFIPKKLDHINFMLVQQQLNLKKRKM